MTDAELLVLRKTELGTLQGGIEEVTKGDKRVKYRKIKELKDEITLLEANISLASGDVKFRTKARTGGSRWL